MLFRGPSPIFVDVLSFERREAQDALWPAYAQFVRTFLLPLLAERTSPSSPAHLWLAHRDGLEPEQVYRSLSWPRRLTRPGLTLASIPTWFSNRAESNTEPLPARASPIPNVRLTPSRRCSAVCAVSSSVSLPATAISHWSKYLDLQTHYTAEQFAAKEAFVASVLQEFRPARLLDIGANTGHFTELACSPPGASVVAIDSDPAAVGRLWLRASEKKLDILPLVVDLCRPTPALGWRNSESPSFLDRAQGSFDMVTMLAVIHHMLVTERVPLEEILDLAASLTTDLLLIEFVEPSDPMFRRLVRGRDALYAHLTAAYFESACEARFRIVRKEPIAQSSRTLYLLRRKP